jgi:hypothetical protein
MGAAVLEEDEDSVVLKQPAAVFAHRRNHMITIDHSELEAARRDTAVRAILAAAASQGAQLEAEKRQQW